VLFERFAPLISLRVCRSRTWALLRSRFQVEDIVQDAWLKVVPGAQQTFTPGGKGSFLAFVSRVVDNTMIDHVRKLNAAKRGEGKPETPLVPGAEPEGVVESGVCGFESPTSSARRTELQEIAQRELSERELLAWTLVEMQSYTAGEAGLAMDVTGAAVRGLLLRARAKLILALKNGGKP
jgi:RNA polymerase sigma factor (sigma-70 family)